MNNSTPERVIKILKNNGVPTQIEFTERGNTITLTLSDKGIGCSDKGNQNMQVNGAAFEGWALLLKAHPTYGYDNVVLDVKMSKLPEPELKKGHFNRFLYRAMRFSDYYKWFGISKKIKEAVNIFKERFYSNASVLVNNIGEGDAGSNSHLENQIESLLYNSPELAKNITGISPLNRQLAVGLFQSKVDSKTNVFTGKKSAIDLWGLSENKDILHIFELKTKNTQVGVLTELFFYACYVYDVFSENKPEFISKNMSEIEDNRGYNDLFKAQIKTISAHILTDKLHSRINDNNNGVITLMRKSCENKKIHFADPILFDYKTVCGKETIELISSEINETCGSPQSYMSKDDIVKLENTFSSGSFLSFIDEILSDDFWRGRYESPDDKIFNVLETIASCGYQSLSGEQKDLFICEMSDYLQRCGRCGEFNWSEATYIEFNGYCAYCERQMGIT